ncbi:MAG TPA: hypothetical protein VK797_21060 [Tepidisphaeraceae bacterium]|jgi:hypothetical protein|nr:hypothetical protein [Tepidisphaeraceae bacterium]
MRRLIIGESNATTAPAECPPCGCSVTKRRKIILSSLVAALVTFALAAPWILRTASLYWAKSSARRTISKWTPEERQFLNATSASIELAPTKFDSGLFETVQIAGYDFRVPRPMKSGL